MGEQYPKPAEVPAGGAAADGADSVWFTGEVLVHDAPLRRYLLKLTGSRDDAEDLLQESFLRVLKASRTTRIDNPRAFLFRTAFNLFVQGYRRAKTAPLDPMADFDRLNVKDMEVAIDDQLIARERLGVLAEAVDRLPPQSRRILIMRKVYLLSHEEIKEALGVSRTPGHGAEGIVMRVGRNAQPLFNLGARQFTTLFHDGRVEVDPRDPSQILTPVGDALPDGLENILAAQALFPVVAVDEMAGHRGRNEIADAVNVEDFHAAWAMLEERIRAIPGYVERFREAYPHIETAADIRITDLCNAIAAFTTVEWRADDSRFDAWLRGSAGVDESDDDRRMAWEALPESNRRNYRAENPPGTLLNAPGDGVADGGSGTGFENFALLVFTPGSIDILKLSADGNRRYRLDPESGSGSWLVP